MHFWPAVDWFEFQQLLSITLRDMKRIIHDLRDSIMSKFGRGEWYLVFTWKSLKGSSFSISLLTPNSAPLDTNDAIQ